MEGQVTISLNDYQRLCDEREDLREIRESFSKYDILSKGMDMDIRIIESELESPSMAFNQQQARFNSSQLSVLNRFKYLLKK